MLDIFIVFFLRKGGTDMYTQPYSMYNSSPIISGQSSSLLRVNGMEGAKAYSMLPNSVVALFDANEDVFYVKTSDAGGFSSIKAFKFSPLEPPATPASADYVTRKEFDELKGAIENVKQSIREQSNVNKQSNFKPSQKPNEQRQ